MTTTAPQLAEGVNGSIQMSKPGSIPVSAEGLGKLMTPVIVELVRQVVPDVILSLPPILPRPQPIVIKQPKREKAKNCAPDGLFLHQGLAGALISGYRE